MRDGGARISGVGGRTVRLVGEKWLDLGYVLRIEMPRSAVGLHVGVRKERNKGLLLGFWLVNCVDTRAILELRTGGDKCFQSITGFGLDTFTLRCLVDTQIEMVHDSWIYEARFQGRGLGCR